MKNLKTLMQVTKGLGVFSLVAGVLSMMALTDIYHGEPDATLEWWILRVSALILASFIVLALYTLNRVSKKLE